jgi:hypothetical protein
MNPITDSMMPNTGSGVGLHRLGAFCLSAPQTPPLTLAAIIGGTGPRDATVTALGQAVPFRWDRNLAGQVSERTPDDGH